MYIVLFVTSIPNKTKADRSAIKAQLPTNIYSTFKCEANVNNTHTEYERHLFIRVMSHHIY